MSAPGGSRTPNLQLRRLPLYPVELQARTIFYIQTCQGPPTRYSVARHKARWVKATGAVLTSKMLYCADNIAKKFSLCKNQKRVSSILPCHIDMSANCASYNPRVQEISRAVARVFHAAGVDFGLMYEVEKNAGNDVRLVTSLPRRGSPDRRHQSTRTRLAVSQHRNYLNGNIFWLRDWL